MWTEVAHGTSESGPLTPHPILRARSLPLSTHQRGQELRSAGIRDKSSSSDELPLEGHPEVLGLPMA